MKVNLVAVQARMAVEDYATPERFQQRMSGLMEQAVAGLDRSLPTLVAYPEAIGLYLSFVPQYYDLVKDCRSMTQAALRVIPRHLPHLLRVGLRHRAFGLPTVFLDSALQAERWYRDVFSKLAREYGVWLLGGSIYLPFIEEEIGKGRYFLSNRVHNIAYFFAPNGLCLRRVPKVNLAPPTENRVGFRGADRSLLLPIDTELGRIGIAICYDAFHHSLIEHYDALGCQIILQPSYNEHPWDAPNWNDPTMKESQVWLEHGLASLIQGRPNIRYGVTAMMVGRIFDMEDEGCSVICRNTGRVGAPPEETIVAMARDPRAEEIVAATVELEEPGREPVALPA